jgi:serine/threonine-protein kinase
VKSGEQAQRALREITILRSLTNPHVVRTFDCGLRPDGHIYLLMDLLTGQTLDEWHDFRTPLHPAQAVTVIHQACLGLAEAHAMGVVHRDVKPENIFIERDGKIKVLDFGLARSWDGTSIIGHDATGSHMLVGTAHYAQPEQMKTMALTPAADVYSLGMIFYELVTGRTPFVADRSVSEVVEDWRKVPIAWMQAHTSAEVVPPLRYLPEGRGLEGVEAVILQSLHKDPSKRPASARELAELIEAAWPES